MQAECPSRYFACAFTGGARIRMLWDCAERSAPVSGRRQSSCPPVARCCPSWSTWLLEPFHRAVPRRTAPRGSVKPAAVVAWPCESSSATSSPRPMSPPVPVTLGTVVECMSLSWSTSTCMIRRSTTFTKHSPPALRDANGITTVAGCVRADNHWVWSERRTWRPSERITTPSTAPAGWPWRRARES